MWDWRTAQMIGLRGPAREAGGGARGRRQLAIDDPANISRPSCMVIADALPTCEAFLAMYPVRA